MSILSIEKSRNPKRAAPKKGSAKTSATSTAEPIRGGQHKTGKPHIVYLSTQAADLLREMKALAGSSEWVLPGRGGPQKPFAHNALTPTCYLQSWLT